MSGMKKMPINLPKMDAKNKKQRRRTRKKIKKLFEQLRSDSNITIDSSADNTVLLLDDTVVECPTTSTDRKRKHSETSLIEGNKCMKPNELASVTITDDVVLVDNNEMDKNVPTDNIQIEDTNKACSSQTPSHVDFAPPAHCSTPLSKSQTNISINKPQNFDANDTKDSFFTIDLTTETDPNRSSVSKTQFNTVIDLDNTRDSQDCTFVSISNASMSGDSDVTVVRNNSRKKVKKLFNGIAKMNASEKGRLLELITQNIFSGCKVPEKISSNVSNVRASINKGTDTAETSYIKEVILGQKPSRNSIGSNIYNPGKDNKNKTGLRMVVIDGSNVAMQHGKGRMFSVRGLQICIDYFVKRGHVVKAFVPRFRCKFGKSTEPRLLDDLERRGLVVYTPSREIQGRMITSYDDRYIVQCAAEFDAVIVTGDNYRDLHQENPRWRFVIENRLLPFTWVNDMIMFPKDPLGRNGPTLEAFLRHPIAVSVPSIVL